MYAPGAATGWYAQQPPTTEATPASANTVHANSMNSAGQAAPSGSVDYSQQYAQYTQYWNQQQAQQQTPPQSGKPQVGSI